MALVGALNKTMLSAINVHDYPDGTDHRPLRLTKLVPGIEIEIFMYEITGPNKGRSADERRIQITFPSDASPFRGSSSSNVVQLLCGYWEKVETFVFWEMGPVLPAWSANKQVTIQTITKAEESGISVQVSKKIDGRRGTLVIAAAKRCCLETLVRMVFLTNSGALRWAIY